MKKFLRDFPAHLQAFKDMRDKFPDQESGYIETFFYVIRLAELDGTAVHFIPSWKMARRYPESDFSSEGVFYFFLYPMDDGGDPDELPGDIVLEWRVLAVDSPMVHTKSEAADWCGVGIRTLQRWIKGTQNREPLPAFKCSGESIFLEWNLWAFMHRHAVGERWKYFFEYTIGDIRPILDAQDFFDNTDENFEPAEMVRHTTNNEKKE